MLDELAIDYAEYLKVDNQDEVRRRYRVNRVSDRRRKRTVVIELPGPSKRVTDENQTPDRSKTPTIDRPFVTSKRVRVTRARRVCRVTCDGQWRVRGQVQGYTRPARGSGSSFGVKHIKKCSDFTARGRY